MESVTEIYERIKDVLELKRDKDLAEFLGISPTYLNELKGKKPPYEKIVKNVKGKVNLEYVFYGIGPKKPLKFDLSDEQVKKNEDILGKIKDIEERLKELEERGKE